MEEHIIIGSDRHITVPETLKKIAVQFDHNAETVTFDCPRYWDEHDLSKMAIYVNYMRPDETVGAHLCDNVVIDRADNDVMHFDWTISGHVTEMAGPLSFLVCIRDVDSEGNEKAHWNTELNTDMWISSGMRCRETILRKYPDIITQLLLRMDQSEAIVAAAKESAEIAEASAKSAKSSATEAEASSATATTSADAAKTSANAAQASATSATSSASAAKTSETNASNSATAAAGSASSASTYASNASSSASAAKTSETNAKASETAAKTAQAAAEAARDAASEIAGGDFASKTEAQGYANTAESNAKSYTDQQIAAIPEPDSAPSDWNQNDPTQPGYIENRTHYSTSFDFGFGPPYTFEAISETDQFYALGMSYRAVLGTVSHESFTASNMPNMCDIGTIFGVNYTNLLAGAITKTTSGPSMTFCWVSLWTGSACQINLYSSVSGMYGAAPSISNFRKVVQLGEEYIPDSIFDYVDEAIANSSASGGGSGVAIGPDEPEDGDVWIDTDDESEDSSDGVIPNGGGNVYGDYTMQGNVSMMGTLQIDSPSQYGSLRTEGSMLAFTGSDGATIYVGGNGNIGDYEIVQDGVPTLTILDNNDEPVRINGVLAPMWDYEAANKQYVDSKIAYGTEDLTAGTSTLETGKLYLVYE